MTRTSQLPAALSTRAEELTRAAAGFRHVVSARPSGVLAPCTVREVQDVMAFAGPRGLPVSARGGGYSLYGQGQTEGGFVLDMGALNRVDCTPGERTLMAGAGAPGRDVVRAALLDRTSFTNPALFSLADACLAVGTLSRLMDALPQGGATAAVEASPGELRLDSGVVIAAVNGPRSVVVSGDRVAVTALREEWAGRGRWTRMLRADVAAHSPHFDALLDGFRDALHTMELRIPHTALVSDITGKPVEADAVSPEFWLREVREPVRFADAVDRLHQDGVTTCLELGPGDVLLGMLDGCLPGDGEALTLASVRNWRTWKGR
ncbi:acyltransferase domain-containing protein [Streptomyces sp. R21]|uniref:Acyltransferase domain-containing protein n=1 Tax=Streptomyces sp. R21 TaxID=3238627 RepID=A0AB39NYQ6_9ACTN